MHHPLRDTPPLLSGRHLLTQIAKNSNTKGTANMRRRRALGGLTILAGMSAWPNWALAQATTASGAIDVAGVRYDGTTVVGGRTLVLNGAGMRYKAIFKVYTAGLYLPAAATTLAAIQVMTGPKRMHIVMQRDIDGNELGKLFTKGIEKNVTPDTFARTIPGTLKMAELFARRKRLAQGESFSVDWVPNSGTVIRVNGKAETEPVPEPEFYSAMLSIWLGKSPADDALKEALLGQAPVSRVFGQ
jgi:hypothetical protein